MFYNWRYHQRRKGAGEESSPGPQGDIKMDKVGLLVVAVLMVGCASLNDGSYMPSAHQEALQNPDLMNCGTGGSVCRAAPGRLHKSYSMCRCVQ